MSRMLLTGAVLSAALWGVATTLQAQTPEDTTISGLQEVTVTAQRREESVQDIPVVVSAFSPEQLEQRNIDSTLDLTQYVPNMIGHLNGGPGSAASYFIRGLGSTEIIATVDPPVGTYVDEIFIARQNANSLDLFDPERIEILRGPQGTLFGRNTTGGAVNVVLKKPAKVFGGNAEIGFGEYNRRIIAGSVDVPMAERFFTKLSAYYNDEDGYADNIVTGKKDNGSEQWGVRLATQTLVSDAVTWDLSGSYVYTDAANQLALPCNTVERGRPASGCDERFTITALRAGVNGAPTLSNLYVSVPGVGLEPTDLANGKSYDRPGGESDLTLIASNVHVDLGRMDLNFITGYVTYDNDILVDLVDGRQARALTRPDSIPLVDANGVPTPNGSQTIVQRSSGDQFSQEIKLSGSAFDRRLDFVGGLYWFEEDNRTDVGFTATIFNNAGPLYTTSVPGPMTTLVLQDYMLDNTARSYAGYLQADWHFSDQFTATAGVRYTDEKKTLAMRDQRDPRVDSTFDGVSTRVETGNIAHFFPTSATTRRWTPRIALNYKPTDDVLLFASYTEGFRSGGWNARGGSAQTTNFFGPEEVQSFELGAKTQWLDNRLRLNLTLFDSTNEDMQLPGSVTVAGAILFVTANEADLSNRGAEFEFQAVPVDNLTLYGSVGIQDAKYENPSATALARQQACLTAIGANDVAQYAANCGSGIVTDTGGIAKPLRSPETSIALGATYDFAFLGGTLTPAVNWVRYGETYVGMSNINFYVDDAGEINNSSGRFLSGALVEPYELLNLGLSWRSANSSWRVNARCDNCANEIYGQQINGNYSYFNKPRTWSLRVRKDF
ncbi:MAG: hypothetical protein AMXMBFR37_10010 [Steroidobacteraceae bacterium]